MAAGKLNRPVFPVINPRRYKFRVGRFGRGRQCGLRVLECGDTSSLFLAGDVSPAAKAVFCDRISKENKKRSTLLAELAEATDLKDEN